MATSRRRPPRRSSAPIVIRETAPRPAALVVRRVLPPPVIAAAPGRRSLFVRARSSRAGSLIESVVTAAPIKTAAQGAGGGAVASLLQDVLPAGWGSSGALARGGVVLGVGAALAVVTGMPSAVIAGMAGAVAGQVYQQWTAPLRSLAGLVGSSPAAPAAAPAQPAAPPSPMP